MDCPTKNMLALGHLSPLPQWNVLTSDAEAMAVMDSRDGRQGRRVVSGELLNGALELTDTAPSLLSRSSENVVTQAVQHIRRMRGGAQSHMMRCADGYYYVVKFQNNPQHTRVLVNDWLGTRLAEKIGLPVPVPAVVDVHPWLVDNTPELRMELGGQTQPLTPGLSFGSRYVVPPMEGQVYDYLPDSLISNVRNLRDFAGILALDKWTCNADGRQVAFWKKRRERRFTASFIDQGYCFNAGEWNFPDAPLRGVFGRNDVYEQVTGWESFEPWLSRIETFPDGALWDMAEEIPPEWYESETDELQTLMSKLLERRSLVRELILSFKHSSRKPFPKWIDIVN